MFNNIKFNKMQLFFIVCFILLVSVSLGFCYINSSIASNNNVTVKKTNCEQKSLYERLACQSTMDNVESKYVKNSLGVNFSDISSDTNGRGVYTFSSTVGDNFPVYYFRGNVDNNNVKFANYCWKIVRTTETGGIKLLFNGNLDSNNTCDSIDDASKIIDSTTFASLTSSPASNHFTTGSNIKYTQQKTANFMGDILYSDTYNYEPYDDGGQTKYHYVLTNPKTITDVSDTGSYRYTCLNNTGICDKINYVFYYNTRPDINMIELENNETPKELLDKMMLESSNENSSLINQKLESWYKKSMTSYSDKLEDAIWCNDREISDYGSWLPDITNGYIFYKAYDRLNIKMKPSIACSNKNFSYTVDDTDKGNGALQYKVGLLTADEVILAGLNSSKKNENIYLKISDSWWTMTPSFFGYANALLYAVTNTSILYDKGYVYETYGIRPSVSLMNGTQIKSGSGLSTDPYVIE